MGAVPGLERALERGLSVPRLRGPLVAGLALLVLAGLLFRLGEAPVSRHSEERCLDVARHMVASGDWLVPVLDGAVRLEKPPLCYWAAAASATALGGPTLGALRLPFALAALALVVAVFGWGRSIGGFPNGALAAGCLLMTMQFWTLGRRGVAEILLALFTTLALFAFDRAYWGRRRAWVPWFFGALWLAFMAKATVALLLIGLPIALQIGLDGSFRGVLRRDVLGWAALCGLASLAWYAALLLQVPEASAALREAALLPLGLVESTGDAPHVRPVWFFVPQLLSAAAPAVLLAPLAVCHAVEERRNPARDPREGFPALAFASLFVATSLIPMKQKHYLVPLLPLLVLAIAPALPAQYARHRAAFERAFGWLGWLLLVAAPVGALLAGLHLVIADEGVLAVALVSCCLLGAGVLGFIAGRSARPRVLALAIATATFAVIGVVLTSFGPLREGFHDGLAHPTPRFDAAHWAATFERHPALRLIYRAQDWMPDAPAAPELDAQQKADLPRRAGAT